MKQIPPVPLLSSEEDRIANRVPQHNLKTYDGQYDPVELEEWLKGIEKIFIVPEVTEEKKVNIGTFYLTREADIW